MALEVIQMWVPSSKYGRKCPYSMNPSYITVHNTWNDASAKSEISYMISNNNQVSYHVAVDDKRAVQAIPFNRNAWHAGDGNGNGNRKSIGVEICYSKSGGSRFAAAEKNAAYYIACLLKERGWGIDRVKRHYDWSGKDCPHRTIDLGWTRFLNMISSYLGGGTVNPTPSKPSGGQSIDQVARDVINGKYGNGAARKAAVEAAGYDYAAVQRRVNEILGGGGSSKPSGGKSIDTVAREVIAGKYGNGDARRKNVEKAGYNYNAVQKRVNEILGGGGSSSKPSSGSSLDKVARDVINGKYGNGATREKKLRAAGYNPDAVQKRVNEILSGKGSSSGSSKKSIDTIAREVIAGKWGNGETRKKKLRAAGYDPAAVQKRVNQLC